MAFIATRIPIICMFFTLECCLVQLFAFRYQFRLLMVPIMVEMANKSTNTFAISPRPRPVSPLDLDVVKRRVGIDSNIGGTSNEGVAVMRPGFSNRG